MRVTTSRSLMAAMTAAVACLPLAGAASRGSTLAIPADVMPFDSALAIDTTGHVWGWGFNYGGELCLGSPRTYSRPVRLPFAHVTAVAGASWGASAQGQAGNGGLGPVLTPVKIVPDAIAISATAADVEVEVR